ncbi:hypothetical protein COOONC_26693 [Cooperia oncophora]
MKIARSADSIPERTAGTGLAAVPKGQMVSISQCITSSDIAEAHSIDESKVKAKLTSIIMRTKLDFSCDDESKESREVNAVQGQKAAISKVRLTNNSTQWL